MSLWGLLYTAADAERELSIPAGTVRSWACRRRLYSFGIDRDGRPMYRGEDLIRLRDGAPELTARRPACNDHADGRGVS